MANVNSILLGVKYIPCGREKTSRDSIFDLRDRKASANSSFSTKFLYFIVHYVSVVLYSNFKVSKIYYYLLFIAKIIQCSDFDANSFKIVRVK